MVMIQLAAKDWCSRLGGGGGGGGGGITGESKGKNIIIEKNIYRNYLHIQFRESWSHRTHASTHQSIKFYNCHGKVNECEEEIYINTS